MYCGGLDRGNLPGVLVVLEWVNILMGGGTNLCDVGLDLSGSWQQGHSATYNAPSRI